MGVLGVRESRPYTKALPWPSMAESGTTQAGGNRSRPTVAASTHCRATRVGTHQRGKKGGTPGSWEKARPGYPATPAPVLPPVETYNRYILLENEGEESDADSPSILGPVSQATGLRLEGERRQTRRKRVDRTRQGLDESDQSIGNPGKTGPQEKASLRREVTPAPRLTARLLKPQLGKMAGERVSPRLTPSSIQLRGEVMKRKHTSPTSELESRVGERLAPLSRSKSVRWTGESSAPVVK